MIFAAIDTPWLIGLSPLPASGQEIVKRVDPLERHGLLGLWAQIFKNYFTAHVA
ncbi:MAG: hypothetical protein ACPGVG_00080 [Mycobacterium sp.]